MECSVNCEVDENRPPKLAPSAGILRPLGTTTWGTASGRRLLHTIYTLIGCPAIRGATYLLVKRSENGVRVVLAVCRTRTDVPSLNLARIRRAGARRGANEVHIFRGAKTEDEMSAIVSELSRTLRLRRGRAGRPPAVAPTPASTRTK